MPLWGIQTRVSYSPRRVSCAGTHMEWMPCALGKHRFTKELMVTLAECSRTLPWKEVASLFGCAWGTIAAAVEQAVAYAICPARLDPAH